MAGLAVEVILTNKKRDEILDRFYHTFDGYGVSEVMHKLVSVLTGKQLEQFYAGRVVTIDPSTNSALLAISARLAADMGYDPEDIDVYRWLIDPLVKPYRR